MFSGSYSRGEVTFLLQQLDLQPIADVAVKEQLLLLGGSSYARGVPPLYETQRLG